MKKFIFLLIILFVNSSSFAADKDMTVILNGKNILFKEGEPYIDKSGRTLVPLRILSEKLGATVEWDKSLKKITLNKKGEILNLFVGKKELIKTSKAGSITKVQMDTMPAINKGITMIPIRFIGENFNCKVEWVKAQRKVIIITLENQDTLKREAESKKNALEVNSPTKSSISIKKEDVVIGEVIDKAEVTTAKLIKKDEATTDATIEVPVVLDPPQNNIEKDNAKLEDEIIFNKIKDKMLDFKYIFDHPSKYKVQVLYTRIKRNENSTIELVSNKFNLNENNYFYPASSIKLPTVLMAVNKLNNIGYDINCNIKSKIYGQEYIKNYIEKIFYYSDNNSFNCLYDFLGPKYLNDILSSKGFNRTKILNKLEAQESNIVSPGYELFNDNKLVFSEDERKFEQNKLEDDINETEVGIGYYRSGDLVKRPFSFKYNNMTSIEDLQRSLKQIFFRESIQNNQRLNLKQEDINFIKEKMLGDGTSTLKYFICGQNAKIPENVKIYNKIGIAYGFVTDNAYITDNVGNEFMLTATIYCNSDGIINDGNYDYEEVGIPFMKKLGQVFMDYTKNTNKEESKNIMELKN